MALGAIKSFIFNVISFLAWRMLVEGRQRPPEGWQQSGYGKRTRRKP